MEQIVEVHVADFAVGAAPQVLSTQGLGSCIAVCLYDKEKKNGALAHMMLSQAENEELNPLRFVDTALPIVLRKLKDMGSEEKDLEAHLVGGASMFHDVTDYLELGMKNVTMANQILEQKGIPIKSQDIGGHKGKSLLFDLETGIIKIIVKIV